MEFLEIEGKHIYLGSGLEKRLAIIVEKSGDSHEDNAAASQDGFIKKNGDNI